MTSSAEDPRRGPIRRALGDLPRHGARLWWIRQVATELLTLRCVEDAAERLKAEDSELLEGPDSDGRAEALIQIIKECMEPERTTLEGQALLMVLDLDRQAIGTTATERRTRAGRDFRGKNGTPVGHSQLRQHYERPALDRLTGDLLAYEDAHIARHDG